VVAKRKFPHLPGPKLAENKHVPKYENGVGLYTKANRRHVNLGVSVLVSNDVRR